MLMKTYRVELAGFGTQYISAEDWLIEDGMRQFRSDGRVVSQFAESMVRKVSESAPTTPVLVFQRAVETGA